MMGALLHTLVWTGVLIAAVLVLRRPVARHFGPQVAYALWALPLARLVLPPFTLPAWMAPPRAVVVPEPVLADASLLEPRPAAPAAPAAGGFDFWAVLADWPLTEALVLVWLGGAVVFLWRRFGAYFVLRDAVLAEGREVGRADGLLGKVRFVETSAASAPLAMGVLDPVIALPSGFMALPDRTARDLALAHELAHHRGGDLLVNMIVQPLFALHWFNPLARFGWLALRRDQEAACDARVMARRTPHERAAYAALIASCAVTPVGMNGNAALAAPMACPVLGETSIIHRLRSLAMSDPTPRRRLFGRALLGAGLLALPLTASITYAAGDNAMQPPEPPAAPDAPLPPLPPETAEAPQGSERVKVFVLERKVAPEGGDAAEGEGQPGDAGDVTEQVLRDADGKERRTRLVVRSTDPAQREALIAELRAQLADGERLPPDLPRIIAEARAKADAAPGSRPRIMVLKDCRPGSPDPAEVITDADGKQTIMVCQTRVSASARRGLEEAREEIAQDKTIPDDTRKQVLKTLDRQIARWKEKEG